MDRRGFLTLCGAMVGLPSLAFGMPRSQHDAKALVVIELAGGNDGLNTVIPFADTHYYALRPTLAIAPARVLRLDTRTGLHPSMDALLPAWRARELAIVQGVGHAMPGASHFRSQQIWRSASAADEYRDDDWLDAIDGDAIEHTRRFDHVSRTIASHDERKGVKRIRLTLHGFDTHEHQAHRHALLLTKLADGMASLRRDLTRSGDWHRTLVMTVSEFGRSARENASGGTDHGAASVCFMMGANVRGGLYGAAPRLDALDALVADDGLPIDIDARRYLATALDVCARGIDRTMPLPILRT
jgi:uncharacterized protein (DUF1501 family)